MMRAPAIALAAALLALCLPAQADVAGLDARLEALTPEDPMAYFRLAEEVAYEHTDRAGVALARRLYVLAYALDYRAGAGLALGSSVCLGLADLATDSAERDWLLALSRVLDEQEARVHWRATDPIEEAGADPSFELAAALGLFRAGRYREASEALARPRVRELLERYQDFLPGRAPAIDAQLAAATMCRECRNRRVVRVEGQADASRLCFTCSGDPGPTFNDTELVQHLRLESILLRGAQRSWSAQMMVDQGAPLRELDAAELPPYFAVDPDLPLYRSGRWTSEEVEATRPGASPASTRRPGG